METVLSFHSTFLSLKVILPVASSQAEGVFDEVWGGEGGGKKSRLMV